MGRVEKNNDYICGFDNMQNMKRALSAIIISAAMLAACSEDITFTPGISFLTPDPEILEEIPITVLKIRGSGFKTLSHRDFMGGILSLGIDRSVVGDIAVISESEAIVHVSNRIAPYICTELTKIGRDGVRVETCEPDPMFAVPRRFEESVITVASARLDGVVKAITGKSRETAAEMVRAGLVELSYDNAPSVSDEVKETVLCISEIPRAV